MLDYRKRHLKTTALWVLLAVGGGLNYSLIGARWTLVRVCTLLATVFAAQLIGRLEERWRYKDVAAYLRRNGVVD